MRRSLAMIIAAAACLYAPAASAGQRESAGGSGGPAASANDDDQIVCRRRQSDFETGSHLARSRRICRTRGQWREIEELTARELRQIRERDRDMESAVGIGGAAPN